MMNVYRYEGPVTSFGREIESNWKGGTQAVSEAKAKANLMYTYKRKHELEPTAKIELPGKITIVD